MTPPALGDGIVVDDLLGRGGMAEVWGAVRVEDGAPLAVKWMLPEHGRSPQIRARFVREQEVLRSLAHPHVVRVLAAGEVDDRPWFAMERLGDTVAQRVRQRGPQPPDVVLTLAADVCAGVGALHALGVVHRDLKPSNLLYGPDGRVRVADLGIASKADDPRITASQAVLGSIRYMAPEQRVDAHRVDARADVYGLAATLRFALTGQAMRDLWREQSGAFDGVPEAWLPLFRDALAWDVNRRPPSVDVFLARLRGG